MIKVITAPPYYPVSRAEAKDWLYLEQGFIAQDAVIDMLIIAMTQYAEHRTGRAFVKRTLELSLDRFGNTANRYLGASIELPWAPLIAIDSIKYTDLNRVEQTVDSTLYEIDIVSQPGRVRPVWASYWPVIGYGFNPVRIQYQCGYAPVGSPTDETAYQADVPALVKTWMHARLATLYENREQIVIERATVDAIPRDFADGLLDTLIIGTRFF